MPAIKMSGALSACIKSDSTVHGCRPSARESQRQCKKASRKPIRHSQPHTPRSLKKRNKAESIFISKAIPSRRRWQANDYPEHQKNWNENFFGWNAADFGWGGDTTRNVLYRLNDGELDGVNPKVVVVMIGTNNVGKIPRTNDYRLVEDVAQGVRAIVDVFQVKAPEAKIILMGITPRSDAGERSPQIMATIDKINDRIEKLANGSTIRYVNINGQLTDEHGKLLPGVTEDGLHLSILGYQIWADALKPIFADILGPPEKADHAPPATGIPQQSNATSH